MTIKHFETPEELNRYFLSGTTCSEYTRIFLKSECGDYIVIKHEGHSAYVDRVRGSARCKTEYYLFRWRDGFDMTGNLNSLRYGGGYLHKWEGRWKKKNLLTIQSFKRVTTLQQHLRSHRRK